MEFMGIQEVISGLKEEKGVEAAYLFGSRATGKAKPYSDTDICVVTDRTAKRERILRNASDSVDVSVFWNLPLGVRYRVIRDGKALFVRDSKKMHRIVTRTVLSYLDFKPLLERYCSRFLS